MSMALVPCALTAAADLGEPGSPRPRKIGSPPRGHEIETAGGMIGLVLYTGLYVLVHLAKARLLFFEIGFPFEGCVERRMLIRSATTKWARLLRRWKCCGPFPGGEAAFNILPKPKYFFIEYKSEGFLCLIMKYGYAQPIGGVSPDCLACVASGFHDRRRSACGVLLPFLRIAGGPEREAETKKASASMRPTNHRKNFGRGEPGSPSPESDGAGWGPTTPGL